MSIEIKTTSVEPIRHTYSHIVASKALKKSS